MLKKSLIAIAVLAIALPAVAGDNKFHKPWPTKYVPQDITTIDVIMDVGYYIHIKNQSDIKVLQTSLNVDGEPTADPFFTYYGCNDSDVVTNFEAEISGVVSPVGNAGGNWSATFNGVDALTIPVGTTSVTMCVLGKDVDIASLPRQDNLKVATLTVQVIPVDSP